MDDPLLTVREFYRERPLTRVIFDRRLRTPATARIFATAAQGPILVITTAEAMGTDGVRVAALEAAGAIVVAQPESGIEAAIRALHSHGVQSLLIEGGAALHAAVWDARLADYVQLYVAPTALGDSGVPLDGRAFSTFALYDRHVDLLGPDVIIEGYVHRPH